MNEIIKAAHKKIRESKRRLVLLFAINETGALDLIIKREAAAIRSAQALIDQYNAATIDIMNS